MTALTADRNTPHKDAEIVGFQVGANVKIFGGSIVVANATGFAVPGTTSTTVTYLGRAEESVNNVGGVDGARFVMVRRKKAFKFSNHAADLITQADVGKNCFIVDDQTVAKTNGGNTRSIAGQVLGVDPDGVWIE
jgi:hypothetical protein